MKSANMNGLLHNGKTLILAYDQGFEHGPTEFNLTNVDPDFIMDIALQNRYSALAIHSGIAEKYHTRQYKDVPLIVKLNGKTRYGGQDPVSLQHTSVSHAIKLGAAAVGYTIYLGSSHEQQMFKEFGQIAEQAHSQGVPCVLWMYPRGPGVKDDLSTETLAYAARVALELGADMVKLKSNNDVDAMKWVVKSAGRTKVVIAGGSKTNDKDFLELAERAIRAGAIGLAVGRNVWQNKRPANVSNALKDIIFKGLSAEQAFELNLKE